MLPSILRTIVPMVVALILGQAARIGLGLDEGAVTTIVTAVIGFAYYGVIRLLEESFPSIGKWLLALGFTSKKPVYVPHR
ncbi:helix-turn-helix domain-containing protein [Actinomadura montaniterrae]|uniref:Uncharacterized protein n=1 Tax=Actinomadura montaniterrae TaxID=1803903 RepID=A0A6L3W2N5_9ACTN|nr:hypothetical protein [Actinomadura montaniterrae]KAB2384767.1 hypothetical protein F9B16_09985 [Actinomadura montaniterrae]